MYSMSCVGVYTVYNIHRFLIKHRIIRSLLTIIMSRNLYSLFLSGNFIALSIGSMNS